MKTINLTSTQKITYGFTTMFFLLMMTAFSNTFAAAHYNKFNNPAVNILAEDSVYMKVDKSPTFPGGFDAFEKFINKTIKYPEVMHDRQIEDDVMVKFIVEADGTLSHFTALNSPGYGAADEAIRVLKLSPKWNPGVKAGKNVRVLFRAPIRFRLKNIQHKDDNSTLKLIKE